MLEWWLTAWSCVTAFFIFETLVSYARKTVYPSDTDVFEELEKDPVLRQKFEDSCRDVLCEEQRSKRSFETEKRKVAMDQMEERRREDEVSELLRERERQVAEERRQSPERSRSFGPFENRGRKSTDGGMLMLAPAKTRGSTRARSSVGRPSMEGNRRMSGDRLGMSMMRRKSEMGAEMTLMEEGTVAGGSTAPGSVRSDVRSSVQSKSEPSSSAYTK